MDAQSAEWTELSEKVMAWVDADPDPRTQRELLELISRAPEDDAAADDLRDRFSGFLTFGTAGLRARLGAGPMRMNRAVVSKAAAGLASYITGRAEAEGWESPRAVIGFDARHNSEAFARDTAAIFTAAEIDTFLMPSPLPTPVLAWATRQLGADVGVMVTASHNPPQDNGYKVYLGGQAVEPGAAGAQIVPPFDAEIAAEIAKAPPASQIPRTESGWTVLPERIARDYEHEVSALLPGMSPASRELNVVLTPMHGVGGEVAGMVLSRAGFNQLHVVPEQALPDPDFPTVQFPNPEEPGALNLAMALAREKNADLVIANDPDADRAGFAVPLGEGDWRMLTGDEVGALMGQLMIERSAAEAPTGDAQVGNAPASDAPQIWANSIVSSRLLGTMAAAHGIDHVETLTGFKWISRVPGLTYGYEEALGYCVAPDLVKDKDGISAALLLADYANKLKAESRTLLDVLDEIAVRHGVHATSQLSIRVEDLSLIGQMMHRLRSETPDSLAGSPITLVEDLSQGTETLPPTDGMRLFTEAGDRVIVRPSGTEPKLKCYLEAVVPVPEAAALVEARAEGQRRLQSLRQDIATALGHTLA